MNFEIGKTYKGYTVESRTKCFVTFCGQERKKVSLNINGDEQIKINGFDGFVAKGLASASVIDFFVFASEVEEPKPVEAPAAEFFIPIVTMYDNRNVKALPAAVAHTLATPYKAPQVAYSEVEVMAASLGYSVLNMGTIKKPKYRLMRDGVLIDSSLYGMGLALFDVLSYLEAERHANRHDIHVESALEQQTCPANGAITTVVKDIPQCGYAIAVKAFPEWFYDDDNAHFDLDFERERMSRMWNRDCDRASSFSMSARYGEGAVV